jgi:hypothetical protein
MARQYLKIRFAARQSQRRTKMDLIERQAAIDVLEIDAEFLNRVLDDTDVVGSERRKYEWGLGLIESYISDICELPSAQPEIIRCRDCLYFSTDDGIPWCEVYVVPRTEDGFCNLAKAKKEEEQA